MRARHLVALLAAVGGTITIAACNITDRSTSPSEQSVGAPSTRSNDIVVLASPVNVIPILRDKPMVRVVVTKTIDPNKGGTLSIPTAGVSLFIPKGALSATTTISIMSMPGSRVAYELMPHGLTFNVPVQLIQDLSHTSAPGTPLITGFYPDSTNDISVTQLMDTQTSLQQATAYLWHFSGFIYASGREDEL